MSRTGFAAPWWLLGCLLLGLLQAGPALAQTRAWFDRDVIQFGDSVTLNVESSESAEPDFTPLEQNFRILSRSTSTEMRIIGGAMTRSNLWAVALEPLHEGVLGVSPIQVGGQRTEPLTLTVRPMARDPARSGDDVFLEVEVETTGPWVQQAVEYTLRLHYAVQILDGSLDEPSGEGVQLRRIGQDGNYSRQIGARRYTVVERRYALTPQRSGTLVVKGAHFRGRVVRGQQSRSFFQQGVPLTVGSRDIELEVRPAPSGAPSPWLPARSLRLEDDAARLPDEVRAGDALQLTLSVEALGLSAEQLPELHLPAIEGAEIYPDQESRETADRDGQLLGRRTRRFAIVPMREGRLELPERSVEWWNVKTDRAERSILPARSLQVLPAAPLADPAAQGPGGIAVTAASADAMAEPSPVGTAGLRFWQGLSLLLLMAWLATLLAWQRGRRKPSPGTTLDAQVSQAQARASAWRTLLARAVKHADASAARRALLQTQADVRDLTDLADRLVDPVQREAVLTLERVLYRGDPAGDLFGMLHAAFARPPVFKPEPRQNPPQGVHLEPLYPDSGAGVRD